MHISIKLLESLLSIVSIVTACFHMAAGITLTNYTLLYKPDLCRGWMFVTF